MAVEVRTRALSRSGRLSLISKHRSLSYEAFWSVGTKCHGNRTTVSLGYLTEYAVVMLQVARESVRF